MKKATIIAAATNLSSTPKGVRMGTKTGPTGMGNKIAFSFRGKALGEISFGRRQK